jgi:Uma2 family endonuclease
MVHQENIIEEYTSSTDYETERDKPMPSRNHALVQSQIGYILKRDYGNEFSILSELSLSLMPKDATPDLCIYPKMTINLEDDDVIKMVEPPLTAIEILSPEQALNDLVRKSRKQYFPNGVKSVWFVFPSLKTLALVAQGVSVKYFTEGIMLDSATGIRIDVVEAFQV